MKNSYLKIIILTVIFGLGAGAVGQLLVNAYLTPEKIFINGVNSQASKKITLTEETQKIIEAHEAVAPAVVEIYQQKTGSAAGSLNKIYLPEDRIALGIVLTSDGWLASSGKTLIDPKNRFAIVTEEHKIFSPEKIIFDEATGIIFLKIDAQNLPTPRLGSLENLSLGEKVILPYDKQALTAGEIKNTAYLEGSEIKDLFRSSEKFSKSILLSGEFSPNDIGGPIVNYGGEVVGIVSDGKGLAVPSGYWQKAFLSILKNGKISRPYLGLNYLDLSQTPGLPETAGSGRNTGALAWNDPAMDIQGVIKNSPAAKAGLRTGDIVLKINSEEISLKTDLSEIIQEYSPGDELSVTILRNGNEENIKLKLEEKL